MKAGRSPGLWLTLAAVLAAGLAPAIAESDTMREGMSTLLIFVTLATSLNILLGYTGYVNFGHIVFFGLGGYCGFYLLSRHGWPLPAAALAGGISSVLLAGMLGACILRLRGAYFALATIGINEAARAFVSTFPPFGGATGLSINFDVYRRYGGASRALWTVYASLLAAALAAIAMSHLVRRSRFGLGLMAIREDEDAAQVMGVRAPRLKTIAYMLSAFFPGVVGVLYFFKNGNVEPGDAFRLNMSIETMVMVMLGGQGTLMGPVAGAAAYERLRGYLITSPLFKNLHLAVAGLSLLLIVLFIPAGAVGWLRRRFPPLRRFLE
ncbi:MAG: branched-chain amino acid ABC transporter permease [Chlamydiota bacterium]